jgi:hypothetical protein
MTTARTLALMSLGLFALLSFTDICSPLECFLRHPSYLVSYVKPTALPVKVATGAGYGILCAVAVIRNQKGFSVLVLTAGLSMALLSFARFILTAAATGEI